MQIQIPYKPLPSGKLFHASNARVKLAVGGKRSGKTQATLEEALMLSFEFPGNVGLMARETFPETQEAIIDPLLKIIPSEVIKREPTVLRKTLEFTNGSTIYFRGLDEHRKSKGLTLGWADVDEVDAVTLEDLIQLDGQISRKASWPVLMATCNPVSTDHWVYKRFVEENLPGYAYYRFPTYDNKENLPDGYIEHMLETMPPSWVRRYLDGQWGSIIVGERVHPEFSDRLHVNNRLIFKKGLPVIRTWDFGNNMAVTFAQKRDLYGLDFLKELFKKRLTATVYAEMVMRFSAEHFPGAMFIDYGDVAGTHVESTSGMSPIDVVNKILVSTYGQGHKIIYEQIPLKDSLDLVSTKLSQIVNGETSIQFHPDMRLTIEALNGGYVWKKHRDGTILRGTPAKDETFEHLMDTVRYKIWHTFAYNRATRATDIAETIPALPVAFEGTSW
jgi:PBSX family phage terminase large subunit